MDGERGTLELLVGPSAVGKTSSLEGVVKSYRWTTREKREGEVDTREFDGTRSTDGFFVDEAAFRRKLDLGELCGVHRYPDPERGHWYGFPFQEMRRELDWGNHLVESTVYPEPLIEMGEAFADHDFRKVLFLADLEDNLLRLRDERKAEDFEDRWQANIAALHFYMCNLDLFDDIVFNPPNRLLEQQGLEVGRHVQALYAAGMIEHGFNPEVLVDAWAVPRLRSVRNNPGQYAHMARLVTNGIIEELHAKGLAPDLAPNLGKSFGLEEDYLAEPLSLYALMVDVGFEQASLYLCSVARAIESFGRIDPDYYLNPLLGKMQRRMAKALAPTMLDYEPGRDPERYADPLLVERLRSYGALRLLFDLDYFTLFANHLNPGFMSDQFNPVLILSQLKDLNFITAHYIEEALAVTDKAFSGTLGTQALRLDPAATKASYVMAAAVYDRRLDRFSESLREAVEASGQDVMGDDLRDRLDPDELRWAEIFMARLPYEVANATFQLDHILSSYAWSLQEREDRMLPDLPLLVRGFARSLGTMEDDQLSRYTSYKMARFVENLVRINTADPSLPNSPDNVLSYPVANSPAQFINTYFLRGVDKDVHDYSFDYLYLPPPQESKEKMLVALDELERVTR